MLAIYKRELKSYFRSFIGFLFIAVTLFFLGLYFSVYNLMNGYPYFAYVVSSVTFLFMLTVPILTMRILAEEKRSKTDQLILTAPVSVGGIVMGKFLALLTIFAIPVAIICFYPLIMAQYGSVPMGEAYLSILAYFLFGMTAIAIGLFMSSLTENQIIAAVCTFGSLLFLYLMPSIAGLISGSAAASLAAFTVLAALLALFLHWMTKSLVLPSAVFCVLEGGLAAVYFLKPAWLEGLFPKLLNSLALFGRFDNFVNGLFDISSLVYFVSVALLFVFFTCQGFEKRRWS